MKFISHNLIFKIFALIIALALWLAVYITQSRTVALPFAIPVQVRGVNEGLVAIINTDQQSVRLSVQAQRNAWQSLKAEDFTVYIDLSGVKAGNYEADVKAVSSVDSISITAIKPSRITVSLEPSVTKEVPVTVKTSGVPASGFVASDPTTDPKTAEVKGPKGAVNSVIAVAAHLDITGASALIIKEVELEPVDANGAKVAQVVSNPTKTTINLPITKGGASRYLSIKPILTGRASTGKWVASFVVDPAVVGVTLSDQSSTIKSIDTQPISIEGLNENKDFTIGLKIPDGVSLIDEIKTVKVSLVVESLNSTKEQVLSLRYDGLTGLKVTQVTPTQITAVVSGPADKLSSLTSDSAYVTLALASYKSAGTFSADIIKTSITLPDGLSIVSFAPSAVTLILEQK